MVSKKRTMQEFKSNLGSQKIKLDGEYFIGQ